MPTDRAIDAVSEPSEQKGDEEDGDERIGRVSPVQQEERADKGDARPSEDTDVPSEEVVDGPERLRDIAHDRVDTPVPGVHENAS